MSSSEKPDSYASTAGRRGNPLTTTGHARKSSAARGLGSAARGVAALVSLAFALPAAAHGPHNHHPEQPASPVACTDLTINPAHGLAGNPEIKSAKSQIIPASGP